MLSFDNCVAMAKEMRASDIHVSVGMPMRFRVNGRLEIAPVEATPEETHRMLESLLDEKQLKDLHDGNDIDFATTAADSRQRVNIFAQQGKLAATIRLLNDKIPSLKSLGLPTKLSELIDEPRGLILVTGPTGSGKSTTLASMVEKRNRIDPCHIITIEDPIEYVYQGKEALIHQREVGRDVDNFAAALRSSLREDPDIILVGEMRDYETVAAALTAAETGHLVLSTLHTIGAAQTIERVIDACPGGMQNQIRVQLASVIKGVITQCLIPTADGQGRVPGTEILTGTEAVANMIRENKCHQLGSIMQAGGTNGMHTLNMDLMRLVQTGTITRQMAFQYTNNRKDLEQYIG